MTLLYLDSADRAALAPLLATGLFAGVTTNPLLLDRAGLGQTDLPALHDWAVAAGAGTVFAQTLAEDPDGIVTEGLRLRELSDRVVVKVPATRSGLTATRRLADQQVPVLITAVYHAAQAVLAAAAGARYIAPYLGRMTAAGRDGLAQIQTMHRILAGGPTQTLVASIKSVDDLVRLAAAGVPSFTIGPALADELLRDDLTDGAVAEFLAAAARNG
ncbi:transaldolase family protein [Solwaraspora sp. WMMD937]|uniref:transaldolase family protein n=1 Tax=Solwaraspora sp. WMMD937 TaxID=3016090 RepID=UPI00249A5562|nr:transaldolase family protein [Solwaraspora sp. WMMD937]WFE20729.1 transaldolase family protein [Solwaraspora sp. WMMD937]